MFTTQLLASETLLWAANVLLQVTLVSVLALLMGVWLRWQPAARFWVLSSALVTLLAIPAAAFCLQQGGVSLWAVVLDDAQSSVSLLAEPQGHASRDVAVHGTQPSDAEAEQLASNVLPHPAIGQQVIEQPTESATPALAADPSPTTAPAQSGAEVPSSIVAPKLASFSAWSKFGVLLLTVWVVGVIVFLVRTLRGMVRLAGILRRAEPADEVFNALLREVRGTLGTDAPVDIVLSTEIASPLVVGVRRAKIVFPKQLANRLDEEQLRGILTHEVAHVLRRDLLMVMLQQVARVVYWFHPLVQMLGRRISQAREEVCDNHVLAMTQPSIYGRTLLQITEAMAGYRHLPAGVGILGSGWKLEARIAGLFDQRRNRAARLSRPTAAAIIVAALLLAIGAMSLHIGLANAGTTEAPSPQGDLTNGDAHQDAAAQQGGETQRPDVDADELPFGAAVRLGSNRFRIPTSPEHPVYFSANGESVITVANESDIIWMNALTGQRQRTTHLSGISSSTFAISPDRKTLAILGSEEIRFCDLESGRELEDRKKVIGFSRGKMQFLADGNRLLVGSQGGAVKILDIAAGEWLFDGQLPGQPFAVAAIAISPDEETIAVGNQQFAYLWKWQDEAQPVAVPEMTRPTAFQFSPDGKLLAVARSPTSDGSNLGLWDLQRQRWSQTLLAEGVPGIWADELHFTADSRWVIAPNSAGYVDFDGDYAVTVWDTRTGEIAEQFKTGKARPRAVSLSPDEDMIAAVSQSEVAVWDIGSGERMGTEENAAKQLVTHIEFTPDDQQILTGSIDGMWQVWDANSGERIRSEFGGRFIRCLDVSSDGKLVAVSPSGDFPTVWNRETGEQLHRLTGHAGNGIIREIAFSPDAHRVTSWGTDMKLRTFDLSNGELLTEFQLENTGLEDLNDRDITRMTFVMGSRMAPDASRVCLLGLQDAVIYDSASGQELGRIPTKRRFEGCSFSPDGGKLLLLRSTTGTTFTPLENGRTRMTGPRDFECVMVDLANMSTLWTFPGVGRSFAPLAISPDGKYVAVTSRRTNPDVIYILDAATGEKLAEISDLEGIGPRYGDCITFSHDGKSLACSMDNTTVLVWKLADFGIEN